MAVPDMAVPDPPNNNNSSSSSSNNNNSNNSRSDHRRSPRPHPVASLCCENSAAAMVDVLILVLVLVASALLFTPYFKYFFIEASEILPLALVFIGEIVYQAPIAYVAAAVLTFVSVIGGMEFYEYKCRKCCNPECRGLRKCPEFDIQLEYEGRSPSRAMESIELVVWKHDHKELEAMLKKMAPPNGRAVLVFRYPCGCPAAHMAVSGVKKPSRKLIKK